MVEASSEVVGYIAGIIYHGAKTDIAKIYSMAVLPRWRNQGVGSLLLKHFEAKAARARSSSITLEVRKSNRPARSLYERFGYGVEKVLPKYYAPLSDGLRMRKLIGKRNRQR